MRPRVRVPGLLVLALLASGCISSSTTDPAAALRLPVPVPGIPLVQDHEHGDPALHEAAQAVQLMSTATGYDGPIPAGVGYGELDINGDWVYVCRGGVTGSLGPLPQTVGGFVVINAADKRAPINAGAFDGVGCADIKVNEANDLVMYGTQRNHPGEPLANPAPPQQTRPRGIYLVNVADKAAPALESFMPIPSNGVHTIHAATMEGRELVFVQTYDWLPDAGLGTGLSTGYNNPATQRVNVFEVQGSPGSRELRLIGVWNLPEPAPPGRNYIPHDITVQKHPLTGAWLGYIAYWDHGLVVINLDDPANPTLVGRNADASPSAFVSAHQARPFPQLIGGKHVTVLEPELSAAAESGQFTLFDTTDPAEPKRLGYWTLPGEMVIPGGFLFSPHNFNTANGRIYLAHNHGGVWVVDASTEERLTQPVGVGYYQPHVFDRADGPACQGRTWSAFYVQGFIYASDSCSGLNILQYDGDRGLEGQGSPRVMATLG